MWKFGSLIMCILFYVQNYFPIVGDIIWEQGKPITRQMGDFIKNLVNYFESVFDIVTMKNLRKDEEKVMKS